MDLLKKHSAEPVKHEEDLTDQVLDWAKDRTEALEGSGTPSEVERAQEKEEDLTDQEPHRAPDEAEAPEEDSEADEPTASEEGPEGLTDRVLEWAREKAEAFEESSDEVEMEPSQKTKAQAPPRVIVFAMHEDSDKSGEAHLFNNLEAAGRFVETLVGGGLDQKRLTVFNCTQLDMVLTYRPVVEFKTGEGEEESAV